MAERRMFAKTIIDSDAFIDMPISARLLYYDLAMRADDDGFVNSPKKIMKFVGASIDDMNVLIARQFILPFESGVVVIKHWLIHNYIRKDRYNPTVFKEEKALLYQDENGAYNERSTVGQPLVDTGKDRLGKVSIGKDNIDICSASQNNKPTRHKYGEYKNVLLSDDELEKLKAEFPADWENRIERLSEYIASTGKKYKNYHATIRSWAKKDIEKGNISNEQNKRTTESAKCEYGTTY